MQRKPSKKLSLFARYLIVLLCLGFTLDTSQARDPLYNNTRHPIPGQIEFENFVAVNGVFRTRSASRYEAGGGEVAYNASNGATANYGVSVAEAGKYEIKIRYARGAQVPGSPTLELRRGSTVLLSQVFPRTPSEDVFETITIPNVSLSAGDYTITARMIGSDTSTNGVLFNWMAFRLQPSDATPEFNLFVSPNGNDSAAGTQSAPYKTFQRAVDRVAAIKSANSNHGPIIINMREGYHEITSTVNMGGAQRVKSTGHVTVKPFGNEEVIMGGGRKINNSSLQLVTDNATLDRLKPVARGKVYRVRLDDADWQARFPGTGNNEVVSYNNALLQRAKYPNKGLALVTGQNGNSFKLSPGIDSPSRWAAELARNNSMHIVGHLVTDEFEQGGQITNIASDGRITFTFNELTASNRKLRVLNVLSELDIPGEWYYDKTSKDFLIWPPAPLSLNPEIRVASSHRLINMAVNYWSFRNITFQDVSRGGTTVQANTMVFANGNNLLFGGCTFRNSTSGAAVRVQGRFNRITGNDIYDVKIPYAVEGGTRSLPALASQSEFTNNHIYNTFNRGYGGGGIGGQGFRFANNVTHNVQSGNNYSGLSDGLMELNEWYDSGYELGDWNPAYVGASWIWGNVIRHNFVHHLIRPSNRIIIGAFRGDDGTAGLTFVGNTLYKGGDYGFAGDRTGLVFSNNVSLEQGTLVRTGRIGTGVQTQAEIDAEWDRQLAFTSGGKGRYIFNSQQTLGSKYWETPHFAYKYPLIKEAFDTNPFQSEKMQIRRNYVNGVREPLTSLRPNIATAREYVADSEDPRNIPTSAFENIDALNLKIKSSFNRMSGFWVIPFEKVGLYVDEFRTSMPHKDTYRAQAKLKYGNRQTNQGPSDPTLFYPDPNFTRRTTYDCGSYTSPLFERTTLLTPQTRGSYGWTNNSGINTINRNAGNALNTDVIYSSGTRTFEQVVENGTWYALITFGDTFAHDRMSVRAEGGAFESANQNFDTGAGQYVSKFVKANVTDGKFSIEISDNGGSDSNWAITRIITQNVPFAGQSPVITPTVTVDTSKNRYDYDFGTATSPVPSGWTRISPITTGDISWSGDVLAIDRGGANVNDINRDLVYSSNVRTLSHKIANGAWNVKLNMGDKSFGHDNMQVRAEGNQVVRNNISNNSGQFPEVNFNVNVSDGELNLEFSDQGGDDPNWVVTRLTLTKVVGYIAVDTSLERYDYDFGKPDSPVFSGWTQISEQTNGDVSWNAAVQSRDRGAGGVNDINRDFVLQNATRVLRHKLANGTWNVKLNMGDKDHPHEQMRVRAEGNQVVVNNISSAKGKFTEVNLNGVQVTDGQLDLEFADLGGPSAFWVVTRMTLTKVPPPPGNIIVDTSLTKYDYDFGKTDSPVPSGWTRISPITNGDISWNAVVQSRDRGAGGVNDINRDFVLQNATRVLRHKLANGTWNVKLNMGDKDFDHEQMRVRAEGNQIVRDNISSAKGKFTEVNLNGVNVTDGQLDLEFADLGGPSAYWVVTRMTLTRVSTSAQSSNTSLAATTSAETALPITSSEVSASSGSPVDVGSLIIADVYRYDFGTSDSPIQAGYTRVSELNQLGYYRWNNNASNITSTNRSSGGSTPNLLRDFNGATTAKTFVHQVENGEWEIKLSFFDSDAAHNDIFVRAEGINVATNIDVNAGQLVERTVTATVTDGELNLQIDSSGVDWILNGLVLTKQAATGNLTVGTTVYLKGNNGRYVTAGSPMTCNSTTTGSAQEFLVVDGGNGTIAFRSSANQFVSSENGNGPINSNRSSVGSWERFTVDNLGNKVISIKGNNNRYISSENGSNPMTCNRTAVGSWERFTWEAK